MSWEDNVHLVPTRNEQLLRSAIGQSIQSLVHYADGAPDSVLTSEAYEIRNVVARQLFSLADGEVVVRLANGEALSFGGSEELASVTVKRADENDLRDDGWQPIDATDPQYSEPMFARAVGHRIVGVRVLRFDVKNTSTRGMSPALERRPREAGVVIELDDGSALLISQAMLDAPNNLGVFPAEALSKTKLTYDEVLCLRAESAKTPLQRIGFFRELRHGKKDGPSLRESVRESGALDEAKVVSYLQAGKVLMAAPGIVRDVLDPEGGIIGSLSILTDGVYAWPSDLAHYVKRYHALLPEEFIAHVMSHGGHVPEHVDLSSVQLA